jgi:hypothetical protein
VWLQIRTARNLGQLEGFAGVVAKEAEPRFCAGNREELNSLAEDGREERQHLEGWLG